MQLYIIFFSQGTPGDSKNAKKKNNKKTNKNKSSVSRANKKKPGMPNVANDLSQKLYATMEKHKEVWHITIYHLLALFSVLHHSYVYTLMLFSPGFLCNSLALWANDEHFAAHNGP